MKREEAINNLESLYNEIYNEDSDGHVYAEAIDMAIKSLSTPSGKWIVSDNGKYQTCSNCGIEMFHSNWNYCPMCGATMKGGTK